MEARRRKRRERPEAQQRAKRREWKGKRGSARRTHTVGLIGILHSFSQYLLSTFYVPGSVLGISLLSSGWRRHHQSQTCVAESSTVSAVNNMSHDVRNQQRGLFK